MWRWLVALWELPGWLAPILTALLCLPLGGLVWILGRNWNRRRVGWWLEDEYAGYNSDLLSEHLVTYHEAEVELGFSGDEAKKGERNRMIVFVPSEMNWLESAPTWAKERREEIIKRIENRFDCEVEPDVRLFGDC